MSSATLTFNLDDRDEEVKFKRAVAAPDLALALWDISQQVFRPARKHGYADSDLQTQLNGDHGEAIEEFVGLLEAKFYSILNEYSINLDTMVG